MIQELKESLDFSFLFPILSIVTLEIGRPPGILSFSVDVMPPPPLHPVPVKPTGVFHEAVNHHSLLDEGNAVGYSNELKVGRLLSTVDFVKEVRQVEPGDDQDREMVDLVVSMVDGYPIPEVFVQVKSGIGGVYHFFNRVGRKLDMDFPERDKSNGDTEYERRRMWMRANRLIVINGGIRKSGPVTDDYILSKFMREVEGIIAFDI